MTLPDRLLSAVGGGMVVAALLLLLFGGAGDGGAVPAAAPPPLQLLHPQPSAIVQGELEIHFTSGAAIDRVRGGWGAGEFHLHAELDGREYMPGPADIRRLPDGSYAWGFGHLPPGEATLRLFWSDSEHRPVAEGASPTVPLLVRTSR